jgi:hypothetical protein
MYINRRKYMLFNNEGRDRLAMNDLFEITRRKLVGSGLLQIRFPEVRSRDRKKMSIKNSVSRNYD